MATSASRRLKTANLVQRRMQRAGAAWLAFACMLSAGHALAAESSPLGMWKSIDEDTHEATARVEISQADGLLSGRVVELFRKPGEDPDPRCDDCDGERHGQRVRGMTILWGMRHDGEEWNGGEILDPKNGKVYRCKLHVIDDGRKLEVRGFIGISLLGRTQTWERATP